MRRAFQTRRVGHAGTLDPFATGLLLVLVGRATRLAPYLSGLPKVYEGRLRLGATTDTDDLTGRTVQEASWEGIDDDAVRAAMTGLSGAYDQEPPQYSAKKVGGRPAYQLARRGRVVPLQPAAVRVARFAMTSRNGADIDFEAEVSAGTYLRSLARDLGKRLGCGAHLTRLRRRSIGAYQVEEAVSLESVREGRATLRPMLDAVRELPKVTIDEESRSRVRHGQPLESGGAAVGPVALVSAEGLVAVAVPNGGHLEPRVVVDPC